jgi:hypothetical protein
MVNGPGNSTVDAKPKTTIPTVRPLNVVTDREDVLALWGRNLPESTPGRYRWLYESERTLSWIARDEQGSAMGSVGLMKRTMSLFGNGCLAGQPIDLNVDRNIRLGGVALRLQRSVTDEIEQGRLGLIYGLPNPQSTPVLRRVGYEIVGPVQRWAKPLQSYEYIQNRLPGGEKLGKAASRGVDAALWLRSSESRYFRRGRYRVEITDCYDERFDQLGKKATERFSIVGERTADYLNWRFRDAPDTVFRALCISDRNDRLLAYLVYTVRDGIAYAADFLYLDDAHFSAVFAEFINLMRVQQAKAVVTIFTGSQSIVRRLKRFGFRHRPSEWKIMVYTDAVRLGVPRFKLFDVNNWFLTRADIDTEF